MLIENHNREIMENTILSWAVGIIGFLATFVSSVAMAYINNVNTKFAKHEETNSKDIKDIHSKFEKYAKEDDLKALRTEMIHNQEAINGKLDKILFMVANKEDRK